MDKHVLGEISLLYESFPTLVTAVRLFSLMQLHVTLMCVFMLKPLFTLVTLEWLFVGVDKHVTFEHLRRLVTVPTHSALVGPLDIKGMFPVILTAWCSCNVRGGI